MLAMPGRDLLLAGSFSMDPGRTSRRPPTKEQAREAQRETAGHSDVLFLGDPQNYCFF